MDIRLERFVVPNQAQLDEVFRLACAAPNYWRLTEGKLSPGRDAIAAWFDPHYLASGARRATQYLYGIRHGEDLLGVVMVGRGHPYPDQATLGLLLLAEEWQGRGIGRWAYQQMEAIAQTWPGIAVMRIGVMVDNQAALQFWRKLGFVATGERKRDPGFLADTVLLEKPLHAHAVL